MDGSLESGFSGKQIQFKLTDQQIDGIVARLLEMKKENNKVLQLAGKAHDPKIVILHARNSKI